MEENFNSIIDFPTESSALTPHPMDLHSTPVPPFLIKTYDMVTDPASDDTVSWSCSSNSFVVWKPLEFGRDVLPKYFKHNNFSSFVRQLNFYGFRKVDPDRWEFANEGFLRGQKHLLKNIHRRKSAFHLQHSRTSGGLEDDVEGLKTDNKVLMLEIVRMREEQQAAHAEMQRMGQRMCIAEQRQQQMMSFLAKAMRNPTFFAQIVQQSQAVKGLSSVAKKRCLTRQETDIIESAEEIDAVILSDNQDLGGAVEDSDAGVIDAFQCWPEDCDVKFIEALNGF